jgi:hypothetical protein
VAKEARSNEKPHAVASCWRDVVANTLLEALGETMVATKRRDGVPCTPSLAQFEVNHAMAWVVCSERSFVAIGCSPDESRGDSWSVRTNYLNTLQSFVKSAQPSVPAIISSVRGLPCGPPNKSSTTSRCFAMKFPAIIAGRVFFLRPSWHSSASSPLLRHAFRGSLLKYRSSYECRRVTVVTR